MIVDAPWYVPNTVFRRDLQIPTVKEEIRRYSSQYSARLSAHPNDLSYQITGDCEYTCQMICLPEAKYNCCICNSSLLGLVCISYPQKPQEALNLLVAGEC
jgi:hypothetical protein